MNKQFLDFRQFVDFKPQGQLVYSKQYIDLFLRFEYLIKHASRTSNIDKKFHYGIFSQDKQNAESIVNFLTLLGLGLESNLWEYFQRCVLNLSKEIYLSVLKNRIEVIFELTIEMNQPRFNHVKKELEVLGRLLIVSGGVQLVFIDKKIQGIKQ